jgi:RNA polymerase subunit RPABC4/transcription elongation factor Spt4
VELHTNVVDKVGGLIFKKKYWAMDSRIELNDEEQDLLKSNPEILNMTIASGTFIGNTHIDCSVGMLVKGMKGSTFESLANQTDFESSLRKGCAKLASHMKRLREVSNGPKTLVFGDPPISSQSTVPSGDQAARPVHPPPIDIPQETVVYGGQADTKSCQACSRTCKSAALFCPYCGSSFSSNIEANSVVPAPVPQSNDNADKTDLERVSAHESSKTYGTNDGAGEVAQTTPNSAAVDNAKTNNNHVKYVLAGSVILIMIVSFGGFSWYRASQVSHADSRSRPVTAGETPPVSAAVPNATPGLANESDTRQPDLSTHPLPKPEQGDPPAQLPQTSGAVDTSRKEEADRKVVKKSTTRPVAKDSAAKKTNEPIARSEEQNIPQGQTASSTQRTNSCKSLQGLYRVTCMIEGNERYFKCAPDGKNWSHEIQGCDRR